MQQAEKSIGLGGRILLGLVFLGIWLVLSFTFSHGWPRFAEGGWGMWPILLVGLMMVTLTIERVRALYLRAQFKRLEFTSEVQKHLMQGNVQQALTYCRSQNQPLAKIVGAGLSQLHRSDQDVQEAMDEAALQELPRIETRTGYLAMIGNIATLLGLLGTIIGLIKSFAGVSLENVSDPTTIKRAEAYVDLVPACAQFAGAELVNCIGSNKATVLAKGISEAMNCTAFGLLVGILALISFSVLNGRTQRLVDDIHQAAVGLLNLAVLHKKSMSTEFLRG